MHPRSTNTWRLPLITRVISDSTGIPPRFLNQATRAPFGSGVSGARNIAPSSSMARGSAARGPTIVLRSNATSATVRAIGPLVDNGDHDPWSSVTRPGEGRKPTTFVNAGGLRSDPPVSLPSAIGTIPHRTAAAAPPLLPPTVLAKL